MSVLDQERVDKIKQLLKWNPRGMTISDLSSSIDMNRNLVSKYLDMLLISGQVEMSMIGPAKVYFLSHRVPISALLEFSSDMVIVLDSGQRILKVNEPVLALLGQTRDAIVGTGPEEHESPFLSALAGYLPAPGSEEISHPIVEFSCLFPDGIRHFRMKQIPTAFEDGGQGITLIIEDITASVSYQENLRMSEARYRGIVEDQTEFIVRFLPDGSATFVNDAYARYLGVPVQDLVGTPFLPQIHVDDVHARDQTLSSLSPDMPVATFECRIRHPCGHDRWNAWTIRALFDDSGTLIEYQGVGRDNTGKREAASKINRYIRSMEFLAQTSMAFRDMEEEDDIFEYVAKQVYSLAPGFMVWVGFLEESTSTLVLKSVVGNPLALNSMENITGKRVADMTFPINVAETAELIRHRKLVKAPPLFELLHMQVPEKICRRIEQEAGGIDSYLMGLVSRGKIVGDVGISMPSGSELPNRELIEAFVRQAAIAIDRKIADDELRKSLAREREQVRSLDFLSKTALDFIDMGPEDDIYRYIGEKIFRLIDCAFVGVNSFDIPARTATMRSLVSDEARMRVLSELGIDLVGRSFPLDIDPSAEQIVSRKHLTEAPPVFYLLFQQVPYDACAAVADRLRLGKNYAMGFVHRGEIFGSVVIVLEQGKELGNRETIEAFVNQAADALLKRMTYDQLVRSLAREQQQVRNLEFLSRTAMDFIDMDDSADIYQYIADRLLELVPESFVGVNSFDPERREIVMEAVAGDPERIRHIWNLLGVSPVGMRFPISEEPMAESELPRQALFETPPLYHILFRQVPEERCLLAEEKYNLGKAFAIGFSCRGEILGNVLIQLTRDREIENSETVAAFVHQASVALLRRLPRSR